MTDSNLRRSFDSLSRAQLAILVPELLLTGHLIDRSGMPHLIAAFGREGMTEVAIEEWMSASPVYTKRMQRALGFEGDDVTTLFKGMQLDIGAPPQFMDFRYDVMGPTSGEFWLDHCGALMDTEPMGEEFVTGMCHDIEDPTFDATALATNPHAKMRPIHRPPRVPTDRHPHCRWSVEIDETTVPMPYPAGAIAMGGTRAAATQLSVIDPSQDGEWNYSGPLLSDLRFDHFSHSALVRICEEVSLQQHMLTLGFLASVRTRTDEDTVLEIGRKQFAGIAGLTSERIRDALSLGDDLSALATVVSVHPGLNPRQYVDVTIDEGDRLTLTLGRKGASDVDGAWPSLIGSDHLHALETLVRGVNSRFVLEVVTDSTDRLVLSVALGDTEVREAKEVRLTRFSTGADFAFSDRGIPLELTVVNR